MQRDHRDEVDSHSISQIGRWGSLSFFKNPLYTRPLTFPVLIDMCLPKPTHCDFSPVCLCSPEHVLEQVGPLTTALPHLLFVMPSASPSVGVKLNPGVRMPDA